MSLKRYKRRGFQPWSRLENTYFGNADIDELVDWLEKKLGVVKAEHQYRSHLNLEYQGELIQIEKQHGGRSSDLIIWLRGSGDHQQSSAPTDLKVNTNKDRP